MFMPVREGDGMATGPRPGKKSDVSIVQRLCNASGQVDPGLNTDGMYGSATVRAMLQARPPNVSESRWAGMTQDGAQCGGQSYVLLQTQAFT